MKLKCDEPLSNVAVNVTRAPMTRGVDSHRRRAAASGVAEGFGGVLQVEQPGLKARFDPAWFQRLNHS